MKIVKKVSKVFFIGLSDFCSTVDAVEGGGNDSSGVSGAFAAWIQAGDLGMLQCFRVARDTHRGRSAGFDAQKKGVVGIITVHLLVAYLWKGILQSQVHMFRKEFVKRCICSSRMV
jgi:hypothetical protein